MSGSLVPPSSHKALHVIDSWPVMEWLKDRGPAASKFRKLLESAQSGDCQLILSSINLGEIYYTCSKVWGGDRAEQAASVICSLPIQVIHPTEQDVIAAARVKAEYAVSYADAFAVIPAMQFNCPLVTGDPEFRPVEASGGISLLWLGA